jgi:penicillin-binding protein 1C
LRLTLARDEQYRVWTPLARIDPRLVEAVQLYEDRWFHWHPGFNPASLMRGAWTTWRGEMRRGGSTISMQLARRLYRIDSRTPAGKLKQVAAAVWLEARHGKARDPGGLPQPRALRRQHRRCGCGQPRVLWQARAGPAVA